MWSARNRYVISIIGVFAGVLGTACGAAATPIQVATPVPTTISSPSSSTTTDTPIPAQPKEAADPVLIGEEGLTWTIEDVDSGTKPALALSSKDVPHIAYMLESQSGFVKNAVRGDSSWDITTVAEGYFYGPLDLAIGADDVPQISYHDHQDSTFQPDKGDAIYASLQEGQWDVKAIFHPGHDGWDNRITVDSQNRPHISAIDPLEFGGNGLQYFGLDDSGTWQVEEVGTGPITYKYATSIAIDPQGHPHITYFDQRDNDLALASKGDSGWSISMVDGEGDTGLFSHLLIDQVGRFHVSYFQRTSTSSGVVKYATRGPAESVWEISEVDTLDKLSFGFLGARNITSLAIDREGNPWIAYSDEKNLKMAVWDGTAWEIQQVVDAGSKTLGQLVSMKLDTQDRPHIAYFEVTNKGPLEGQVKYALGTP